jgi:hypothetical protein
MEKLTGFEKYLVIEGLQLVKEKMKAEIDQAEGNGKIPLMTKGYIDMVIDGAENKIPSFSIKEKKSTRRG